MEKHLEEDDMSTELRQLLAHPIPVLSNVRILNFMRDGMIRINPFAPEQLGPTCYRLRPGRIRFIRYDEGLRDDGTIALHEDNVRYRLEPQEHVVVSINEEIEVSPGVVADFYPSSYCIEQRLVLTAGRLDAHYKHAIVFGVFNAGVDSVELTRDFQLARVTFGWLGQQNIPNYDGVPPGSYIHRIEDLRRRENELETQRQALESERHRLEAQIRQNKSS